MANKIIPKRSSVVAKVPLAGDLEVGEIAVNLADALIFTKNAAGVVITLGGSSGGSSLPTQTGNSGGFLATSIYHAHSGSGTFTRMADGVAGGNSSCLIISRWSDTTGVKPCSGQLYASSSPTVAIDTATALDRIQLFCGGAGTYTAGTYYIYRR